LKIKIKEIINRVVTIAIIALLIILSISIFIIVLVISKYKDIINNIWKILINKNIIITNSITIFNNNLKIIKIIK